MTRHTTSRSVALAALVVALPLLGGCSFLSGSADASGSKAAASSPADASSTVAADTTGQVRPVGPFRVEAADYWRVSTKGDVTHVAAAGCQDGQPCPGFDIVTGKTVANEAGADGSKAYLPKGTKCPGKKDLTASVSGDHGPTTKKSVVAGSTATRTEFVLACVDGDGNVGLTTTQVQWYVPSGPEGPVLVVDRWAFDGLDARLAAATWAAE